MMPITMPPLPRRTLLACGAAAIGLAGRSQAAETAKLEQVAVFTNPHQVTGVAVSPTGRVFVNFPRWEEDVAVSVAEVGPGGKLTPYPDAGWNSFRNTSPSDPAQRFVCVQSVTFDAQGNLWVLDPAAPALGFEVTGGPKLVKIDLARNTVSRIYTFDDTVAPQGTYLNDIRFTPDGQRAVITNSGQPGCLITLDVASGKARRVLDGHPSTQFQKGFVVTVDGKQLRRLDGETAQFSADGLALDPQGEFVYWQATTGKTMYRVPVKALFDEQTTLAQLQSAVETHVQSFLADGYWMTKSGASYLTSCADNSVKRLLPDKTFTVVVKDPRLVWPDSMAEGPDGSIYVTNSNIPKMKNFQGPGVTKTELYKFKPA